ncbi:hypothetical protein F7R25_03890 [Burkholderia stagnalis]|uniref:Uncharacterized protein n=1 Tax=Burkholderia stagnalis TaxID=1503054 RepID=A0A6L3N2Y9_9BURK|nr:hypothetical protein [Burkholderia stagnalis]KAB0640646.1 hypothetical protein F7R25_03890 [Burkholderia stagnalis]
MSDLVMFEKERKLSVVGELIEDRIQSHRQDIASGMVGLSRAEIFRRYAYDFETRLRYYVGEDNYYDEVISILACAGYSLSRSDVAFNLSKACKEIGFDRDKKQFKRGRKKHE